MRAVFIAGTIVAALIGGLLLALLRGAIADGPAMAVSFLIATLLVALIGVVCMASASILAALERVLVELKGRGKVG